LTRGADSIQGYSRLATTIPSILLFDHVLRFSDDDNDVWDVDKQQRQGEGEGEGVADSVGWRRGLKRIAYHSILS
jgi:hypothetical protein